MGLLSDTKNRQRMSVVLLRVQRFLCLVLYVGGSVGFLAIAYQPLNNKTYFSENALLAGLVDDSFDLGTDAKNYYKTIKEESKGDTNSMPASWIANQFAQQGLDVFVQNFSYKYPLDILKGQVAFGKNVYAILRAPKSASTEALVISAPYRHVEQPKPQTNAGIALMMALAKYFKGHTYWAKDIIFLVTEQEEIGMQAWLNAYHDTKCPYIRSTSLEARGGAIQAAVNLELQSSNIDYIDIKLHGLNGQLPNLDLFNVAIHLCEKLRIRTSISHQFDHYSPLSRDGIVQSLKTYALHMWAQITNTPTGNHGLFHKYRIEALTLSGVRTKTGGHEKGFVAQGRVIEGLVRSLNNLLERFHQSFFFYLLPATHRYVSIGLYMGPFAALAAAGLVKGLCIWLEVSGEETINAENDDGRGDKPAAGARKLDDLFKKSPARSSYSSIPSLMIVPILFGLSSWLTPRVCMSAAQVMKLPPDDALALGFLAVFVAAMFYPHVVYRKGVLSGCDWRMLKCVALIYQGLILYGLSVMNISMAYCIAVCTLPVTLLVRPVRNWFGKLLAAVFLIMTSPLGLLFISSMMQISLTKPTLPRLDSLILSSWLQFKECILWSVVDWHIFGNWMYQLVALILFPNWLMFWGILWWRQ